MKLPINTSGPFRAGLIAAALAGGAPAMASCGAAFCTVNTNWTTESAAIEPGSSFDLRYEYIDLNQPRAGKAAVAVGQVRRHHDEVSTANRNLLATYSRNFGSGWGFSVTAPLVDRDHEHIHNHHGTLIEERWSFTELGDIRAVGRYQLPYVGDPLKPAAAGFNFGLKLPTGRFDVANGAGDTAERSLQPGTGTTDAIAGFYYHQRLAAPGSGWFAQAQYQHALNSRQDYRPGNRITLDTGYRHGLTDRLGAQVQLNLLWRGRDSGREAEPEDSGGRFAFVSPGLTYALSDRTQLYGYVQLPVYQQVNGVQLTADKGILVGFTSRF